jgi:hypothetical protein
VTSRPERTRMDHLTVRGALQSTLQDRELRGVMGMSFQQVTRIRQARTNFPGRYNRDCHLTPTAIPPWPVEDEFERHRCRVRNRCAPSASIAVLYRIL